VLSRLLGRTITYRELSFDENKNTMVTAGVPEAIAEQNAQAFSLTAEATQSGLATTCRPSSGAWPAPTSSSPRTTPPHSRRSASPSILKPVVHTSASAGV